MTFGVRSPRLDPRDGHALAAFRSGSGDRPDATRLRTAFRARCCPYDDQAAERVVRRVLLGDDQPIPPLPAAERTVAPTPRGRCAAAAGRPRLTAR
ncbi:hypothetical protein [Streptomyces pinistramenti]|uniref:hypothetical protein n=1 Tax=Streptomyces pinistramenti TaxID=2884812 RepID=UPI0027E41FBA|nr:hypothetical protein [Streptomyces pinistramenti]